MCQILTKEDVEKYVCLTRGIEINARNVLAACPACLARVNEREQALRRARKRLVVRGLINEY